MNRAIHGTVFTASLFVASLAFAQAAAPAAGPATDQPAANVPAATAKGELTPQQQKIADLIKQLGSADFPTRDAASNELLKLGVEALPALREALKSEDPSIQSYAEYLVPRIEGAREGRDLRRFGGRRVAAGAMIVPVNPGLPRDVLVARAGRININVAANDGQRTTNIVDGNRKIVIDEGPDGIRMNVTDNDNGKVTQKDYEAKSIEDLRKNQPEAAEIYDKYTARGRGLAINGNARIMRLPAPVIDNLDADVRKQIEEAQRQQDQAMRQNQAQLRDLLDRQNLDVQDRQLELIHKRLQAETERLERRLAEVEAMHKQLLEQTQAAQKRLAELEKQQQEKQQEKQEKAEKPK
ncbi:MAG TPA: hypothetical protein VGP99_05650 [Tepidisphaeraceae bacterium]|jgi:hypothetical protein|nr:hypothetical protein [Tepidisphaeraceae bacterium]